MNKKAFYIVFFSIIMILLSVPAYAGDIPESLLHSDDAKVFFGEVTAYHPDKENPDIEVTPVKKIKGDVKPGTKRIYYDPNPVGDFKISLGNVYLFTCYDDVNPTDIFEVTSYDTKKLKIKNVKGDMWDRFQKYLNDGEYEKAEAQRIDKKNEKYPVSGEQISLTDYVGADRSLENRSVSFYSGPNAFEVDKKKFLEVADTIMLNKIETTEVVIENWHGIYISAAESNNFAFISSDGKISRNNPTHSILLPAEYIIKGEDIAKLYTLFPEESKQNIPPLNRAYIKYIICGAVFLAVLCGGFGLTIRQKNRR